MPELVFTTALHIPDRAQKPVLTFFANLPLYLIGLLAFYRGVLADAGIAQAGSQMQAVSVILWII